MALKAIVDALVELPGNLRDLYVAKDGKFHLDVTGHPDTEKLASFRENNRALQKKLQQLGELDPVEHAKLKQEAEAHDAKLTAAESARVAAVAEVEQLKGQLSAFDGVDVAEYTALKGKPPLDGKVTELETQLASEKAAHAATAFKTAIAFDFLRIGGRPGALDYIVGKAAETFSMKDGKVTTAAFSAKTPGVALTVSEWMETQLVNADFAFAPSKGGGAQKGNGGPQRATVDRHDALAVGRHLQQIADGTVDVR